MTLRGPRPGITTRVERDTINRVCTERISNSDGRTLTRIMKAVMCSGCVKCQQRAFVPLFICVVSCDDVMKSKQQTQQNNTPNRQFRRKEKGPSSAASTSWSTWSCMKPCDPFDWITGRGLRTTMMISRFPFYRQ
jgi:hypothetical protein